MKIKQREMPKLIVLHVRVKLGICIVIFSFFDLQGYAPGLIGVSHGALQFMAYEELKKGYSQYFGTPINKKLVIKYTRNAIYSLYLKHSN